jgi:hypothetical protein
MDTFRTYNIFGPSVATKRMRTQLFENIEPKHTSKYTSSGHNDTVHVAVYEEYEKQINASVTLTCVFIFTGKKMQIDLIKTGGRVGFRGSSLTDKQRTIDDEVIEFIKDFGKRHGLTVQQQDQNEEEKEEKEPQENEE